MQTRSSEIKGSSANIEISAGALYPDGNQKINGSQALGAAGSEIDPQDVLVTAPARQQAGDDSFDDPPIDKYMGMFTGTVATKVKQKSVKVNAARLLLNALSIMLAEYTLYFILQLVSYLVISKFWISTTYVLGTVFGLLLLIIGAFLIRTQSRMDRLFPVILKVLEFVVYLVFISWAVAYLDFAFLALSYMMIFNILALMITVG